MTPIRQLIQTTPTKANELFVRLGDTSESAVKTRARLLADLKEELELLTELEEKHLFPVLRKHKQTKDLVADAIGDNKQMRKLLAELDKTPPESAEFGGKVDFAFNDAISFQVSCADQAEVDEYWSKLTADGGREVQCGWLKDKYGLSWQIVPEVLTRLIADPDKGRAGRVMAAMMQMVKIDIAKLEEAAAGHEAKVA